MVSDLLRDAYNSMGVPAKYIITPRGNGGLQIHDVTRWLYLHGDDVFNFRNKRIDGMLHTSVDDLPR